MHATVAPMVAHAYRLYGLTIFLSAFLLFLIQPLVGRHLLPWFGGATAVWATSLLFFTTALFLGYAYTYYLSRLAPRLQVRIHMGVLLAALIAVVIFPLLSGSIYPSLTWTIESTLPPAAQVLLALAMTIGIPYLLLATTGPLVQHWFGVMESKEPYHLYSLSNIASFLALGAYPFLIEPTFTLSFQKGLWMTLFVLFVLLYGAITYMFMRRAGTSHVHAGNGADAPTFAERFRWVGFAALPAALLVATTAQLTQAVAPVPFLWVIPLAIYLLTFVIAFRGWGSSGIIPTLLVISGGVAFFMIGFSFEALTRQLIAYLSFFFFACLYCHAQLYATRPPHAFSSLFYLMISLGGMVGTTLVSIVAPLVFTDIIEFPMGIALTAGVAVTFFPAMRYVRDEFERSVTVLRLLALAAILVVSINHFQSQNEWYSLVSRNFYGVVKLGETSEERSLYHGTTFHGKQLLDPELSYLPTTYYTAGSGFGRALQYVRTASKGRPITVGTVGLGTGTIAAFCKEKDRFIFYEIDPRIEDIAREYFTYLAHCAESEVRIGDARLLLDKERREGKPGDFDLLAIDAFSDDTIPAHLLTKEALELYMAHLRDDRSILVIHTSNRYLNLDPVVRRIADELGLSHKVIADSGEAADYSTYSEWVVVARDPAILASKLFDDAAERTAEAPLWTDDYMNILAVLDLPAIYNFSSEE